ncbi:MAG: TetR/AcrR family transcriptional regulator [Pseudonocardiales bacterium]|jgi:AcrR family transcriptional regulator|nr:TetR/AcrR family transcriptional regulator [Pseudonocardiales bacterium]
MRDRRAERFEATQQEILDVAWGLVRADGLAGLSMRELGARVGLRAQSLYVYFPSKHAIYDAMFLEANRELLDRRLSLDLDDDPVIALRQSARQFVDFCTEDLARYQLLFQRTIPGFEPSEESYAVAREVLDGGRRVLAGVGVTESADVDLYTGLISGLVAQQNANEPGGDRWTRQLDRAIDMYLAEVGPRRLTH